MPIAIFSLFLAAFTIGTTQFVVAGLLPPISSDLGVSIPTAGYLVSGYAIGVAIGGPLVSLALSRVAKKRAILILMSIFVTGHVWCALAPSYETLMAARVFVSLSHGSFMGVAVVLAMSLVPPERRGSAIAVITAGITVANVLGVPGGTAIGTALGWRATFWIIGGIAIVTATVMTILLPADKPRDGRGGNLAAQFRVLGQQKVYVTFAIITSMMIGFWALFTFVAPLLLEVSRVPLEWVAPYLIGFGVGATAGSFAAGPLADRWPTQTILLAFPAQIAVFIAVMLFAGSGPAMAAVLFVLGFLMFLPNASLISRVFQGAAAAPDFAATLISTVFNIGIAAGAWAGAQALNSGAGYQQLPWFGVAFGVVSTGLAALTLALDRRKAPSPVTAES
ncbi:MAG: MFS transporter [Cucumibacter sp.]